MTDSNRRSFFQMLLGSIALLFAPRRAFASPWVWPFRRLEPGEDTRCVNEVAQNILADLPNTTNANKGLRAALVTSQQTSKPFPTMSEQEIEDFRTLNERIIFQQKATHERWLAMDRTCRVDDPREYRCYEHHQGTVIGDCNWIDICLALPDDDDHTGHACVLTVYGSSYEDTRIRALDIAGQLNFYHSFPPKWWKEESLLRCQEDFEEERHYQPLDRKFGK